MLGGSWQGLTTTTTLVQICQNVLFKFSFRQGTYLGIVQGASSIVGVAAYYYVQRYWKMDVKKMARIPPLFLSLKEILTIWRFS